MNQIYIVFRSDVFVTKRLVSVYASLDGALGKLSEIQMNEGGTIDKNHLTLIIPHKYASEKHLGICDNTMYHIESHNVNS